MAFVKLTNGHATYAFYDENTAGRMLAMADLPTLPARSTAYFTGGIWLVNGALRPPRYEALQTREAPAASP